MKHRILWMGLVLVAVMGMAAVAGAADVRIAVIDFQRILDDSRAGKAAQESINQQGRQMESELKAKGDALEQMKEQLQKDALVMSKETREEKEREFRIQINDFRESQQEFAKKARELQMRAMGKIRQEIDTLAKAYAEEKGFTLMIEKQEAGVIYVPAQLDVTDEIIRRYDAQAQ
ncbi:MAG: OmpH family outer membrane protein [Desulfobacteraceae bacterium]|nr:OmpH family outer membrane protein [Desulfobacteraceae bacterium]